MSIDFDQLLSIISVPSKQLTTRRPWDIIGISRASFFRLEGRPHPIRMEGFSEKIYRVSDLVRWINKMPSDRRPGRKVGKKKISTGESE